MKNYIYSFYLLLITLIAGPCYAQNLSHDKTGQDVKREKIMDSINNTLNHIHIIRNINPDSALKILDGLYSISLGIGYREGVGGASAEIGGTYIVKGDFQKAERYILYSQLFPKLNEYISTNAINNLHLVYESRGNYELALKYLKKAMASKDKNVAFTAYNNYIALLLKLGKNKESLYYINILKGKAKALHQYRILAAALCNEATVYSALKQYKKSDSITAVCLKLCNSYPGLDDIITYCMINSGTSYFERGDADQAIRFFNRVKENIPQLQPDYQMNYYSEYGRILYKTGSYQAAIENINKGVALAKKIGVEDNIEPLYYLAKSYSALGDHDNAEKQFETYIALKDSFRNIAIQNNINEYEIKFRTAEKDNELLNKKLVILSQTGKINRKNTWILLSLAGLVILAMLFFFYFKYSRQNLLMLAQDLDIAQQQARINFLKAIMQGEEKERKRIGVELHNGIGSQLTAINLNLAAFQWKNKHVPEVNSLDEIVTQVQDTAIEVRKTAHNLLPSTLVESGLFEAIKDFTRYFNNDTVQINISQYGDTGGISPSLSLLVYRILQELINNAVKHAKATRIDINLKQEGDMFSAGITDNGKGFDLSGITGSGIGIRQIREQLDLLKGTLKLHTPSGGGTAINFEINLKHAVNEQ
jgi:two-component system NarL family sensor kinase